MMMMAQAAGEKRRSFDGFLVSTTTVCSAPEHKRLKTGGISINTDDYVGSKRDKKDKFGEKIAALQQLVSPFGKTDTASVLHEATGYIRFLHDQLRVLSAPYLQTWIMKDTQETEHYSLRSRGLCLMPVSYTSKIARSNGADIWAP